MLLAFFSDSCWKLVSEEAQKGKGHDSSHRTTEHVGDSAQERNLGSDWTKSKVLGIFAKRQVTLVDRSTKTLRSPVIVVVNATGFFFS